MLRRIFSNLILCGNGGTARLGKSWLIVITLLTGEVGCGWRASDPVVHRCGIVWADFHRVYRAEGDQGEVLLSLAGQRCEISSMALDVPHSALAVACSRGFPHASGGTVLRLFDSSTIAEYRQLAVEDNWVGELRFSIGGAHLAYLSTDRKPGSDPIQSTLKVLSLQDGAPREIRRGALSRIRWGCGDSILYVTEVYANPERYRVLALDLNGAVIRTFEDSISIAPFESPRKFALLGANKRATLIQQGEYSELSALSGRYSDPALAPEIRVVPGTDVIALSRLQQVPLYDVYLASPPYSNPVLFLRGIGIQDYAVYLKPARPDG